MARDSIVNRKRRAGWTIVAMLCALCAYGGCLRRAQVSESTPPSTNPSRPFSIAREGGNWWLTSPAGDRFFSMGACVVDFGSSKEEFDPENPSYAAWQHYANPQQWAAATAVRLKSWGFTTAGGWSDYQDLRNASGSKLLITPSSINSSSAELMPVSSRTSLTAA